MGDVFERIAALPAEKRALLLRQLQERETPVDASSISMMSLFWAAGWSA